MNNNVLVDFGSNNSSRRHQLWHSRKKSKFSLTASKKKIWNKSGVVEYLPLVSDDVSDDEEIAIHDASYLELRQRNATKTSNQGYSPLKLINGSNDRKSEAEAAHSDHFRQCEFVPLELKKGDTLQSISVKYRCPISDIKRANNLISDQEFYALRHLKIPVRKYGLLSQILNDTESVKSEEEAEGSSNNSGSSNVRTINIGIGLMLSNNPPEEAAAFMKKMDEDLVKIMLNTKTKKDSLEEAAAALTAPSIQPLVKDSYSDVECGIQWSYLIVFMLIIAIVLPMIIIIHAYYIKSSSHPNHDENYSNDSHVEPFSSSTKPNVLEKT